MRRIIIGVIAVLLAVGGGTLTFLYASGADARAMAQMTPTQVLVVAETIPAGTPGDAIGASLVVQEIPAAAVVPGGVTDIAQLSGLEASADLQPGEQLLAARFEAPQAVAEAVEVPPGMHQLTIELEPRRVLGGELEAGDTIGIFVSRGSTEATHLMLHKVLVLAVAGGPEVTIDENGNEVEQAAASSILVTVALSAPDAERLVFAAEYDRIYLSLENADVSEQGTRIVDGEVIFG
ncbi:RcpC/CpaB family pilus assembly protein [Agrococcus sp. ARC_14]|uniref:Flp pilus assembly protein CpaB n=1 Tax=Agrococcus sp. ARC_14 TaxID=2919927 RepID=UPI001F06E704|nr:RcpC/CpaB family pilus assembly protein [Agrococcus sp. ARC_14]MCH1883727.1 RcpC/CpaB family pilus assembly protein [Agrococcus sp. ARC_14]